jgi:hypothetical protein
MKECDNSTRKIHINSNFMCEYSAQYIFVLPSYNQQDATFIELSFTDALHVSVGSSAHHQEHITVHTALSIVNQYCSIGLTIPDVVCTIMCS